MILGIDISTSITGYTVIDKYGTAVICDHIALKDEESLFTKAELVKRVLASVFEKHDIEKVYIESSLLSFAGGKSSASVIATLTKFNGIISYIIRRDFYITPEFIMATSARKQIGIKIVKGTKKAKEQVMDHITLNETWFPLFYKKTGKIKDYCFDLADSWVIAKAGYLANKPSLNKKMPVP